MEILGPGHNGSSSAPTLIGNSRGNGPQMSRSQRDEMLRKLKSEAVRLKTFRTWISAAVAKEDLARNGFFYFNVSDHVQCAFCLIVIGNWTPSDDVVGEHRTHSPRCPFTLGLPVGNVPILPRGVGVTSPPSVYQGPRGSVDQRLGPNGFLGSVWVNSTPEKGGISKPPNSEGGCSGIAVPKFIAYEQRLATYKTWPKLPQKPDEMAKAGLYYTGMGDEVKCFHCGGGIQGWERDDVPMKEHARLYRKCRFVLENFTGDWKELDILNQQQQQKMEVSKAAVVPQVPSKEIPLDTLCKICLEKPMSVLLLPCAHMCACVGCISSLTKCPVCRKPFRGTVKVKLPN